MNLFENLQKFNENSDLAKLGKKIKQYKGWKIYKGIDDYGNEIFRLFTPDEYRPEIGYEDWETDTLDQAISWVDNYNLDENYDYYDDESDYYDDFYDNKNSELVNRYKDMYDSEMRDLEEKLSFSEFCKKFDDTIKQSFDTVTGEEDSYKKYPSSFSQHQTYAYDDYLNGTSYFEDEMLEETTSSHEKYSYSGPVYRFERIIGTVNKPIYTIAVSKDKAYSNFCYKLKKEYHLERGMNLTIDKNGIKLIEPKNNKIDFEETNDEYQTLINDPKYNFEDPDREDDYVVESTKSFNDWFDENYQTLVQDYIELNEIDEDEINDIEFREYADDRYEEYYRNYNWRDENLSKLENITLNDLKNAIGSSSFMNDRAYLKVDDKEYIKIDENKWEYTPILSHALPIIFTDDEVLNLINNSNDAKLYQADGTLVEDFEVQDTEQEFTSAKTSINSGKLPAIFKMINLKPGTINIDFGGGRFDNVAEYYADKDITNLVYDPYNRSSEHNKEVINKIRENGGADSCTLSNVLNVIKEPEARKTCLQNCYNLLKSGGDMYITVYEGNGSGKDKETSSGYQLNKKTKDYLEEIQEVFPNAKRKGKLIYATK